MIKPATEPLKFPAHYPPTDKWKKFFIDVRWLGPDLSFFKDIQAQQASRDQAQMHSWGGGRRQEIASRIATIFHTRLRWDTDIFLPDDQFAMICHGSKFNSIDDSALEAAIEDIEKAYKISIPNTFWIGCEKASFGEIVDAIASFTSSSR